MKKQLKQLSPHLQLQMNQERLKALKNALKNRILTSLKLKRGSFLAKNFAQGRTLLCTKSFFRKRTTYFFKHSSLFDRSQILLKKGYSILFSEKLNSTILSCKSLQKGDRLIALLSDGKVGVNVEEIEEKS